MAQIPEGTNPLAIADADNEVLREADNYLREHKILELFEDLTTLVAFRQPEHVETFLIEQLKQKKINGNRSVVYSETDLQNIYSLYDLKGTGFISHEQTREALKSLANSEFHYKKAEEA